MAYSIPSSTNSSDSKCCRDTPVIRRVKKVFPMCQFSLLVCVIFGILIGPALATVSTRIACQDEEMRVEISGEDEIIGAHLQGLKNYPDKSCRPEYVGESQLLFRLGLKDFYRCGTTQILNKITGMRTFYNRVVILAQKEGGKEEEYQVLVKCQLESPAVMEHLDENHLNSTVTREKRDILPAGFQEPETLTITNTIESRAPIPMLSMYVRQDGRLIGEELIVQPGSPLTMEVSLDQTSRNVYGILMSQLDVTDTGPQSEVILLNGCSVDPYLFENFVTDDGDLLTARFKAFKFPDSNYILFRGTVNVCLGSCEGINCRSGQIGYGRRRRRAVATDPALQNRVYEVQMTTIIRVANPNPAIEDENRAILRAVAFPERVAKREESIFMADLQTSNSSSSSQFVSSLATILLAVVMGPLRVIFN